MTTVFDALKMLAAISPIALALILCGGLGYIIYLLISKRGPVRSISENHLACLPEMLAALERIETSLSELRDGMAYLKGRINGRPF